MTTVSAEQLPETVKRLIQKQQITDVHTHLYSPNFNNKLLWGLDELLTYHYLVAEVMLYLTEEPAHFLSRPKRKQAEMIWETLFVGRSPLSEATRGVVTTLRTLGIDIRDKDLTRIRSVFDAQHAHEQTQRVMNAANISDVVMTNDPFDEEERQIWLSGKKPEKGFHAALRIDPVVYDYANQVDRLQSWGYDVRSDGGSDTVIELKRFMTDWIDLMNPLYMACSLPGAFQYPGDDHDSRIFEKVILPIAAERQLTVALMLGAHRQVNPELADAGDYMSDTQMQSIIELARRYPKQRFLITVLTRKSQHDLAVLGRKFHNIMVFGCWWFVNIPELISEISRMRMELLGSRFIPQHSDARVLEQLTYKWQHSREILTEIIIDKYIDLIQRGWPVLESDIQRDLELLLQDNFWNFIRNES